MRLISILGYDRLYEDEGEENSGSPSVSEERGDGADQGGGNQTPAAPDQNVKDGDDWGDYVSLNREELANFLDKCQQIKVESGGNSDAWQQHEADVQKRLKETFQNSGIKDWVEYDTVAGNYLVYKNGGVDDKLSIRSGVTSVVAREGREKTRQGGKKVVSWKEQKRPFFVPQPLGKTKAPDFLVHLGNQKYVAFDPKSSKKDDRPSFNNTIPKGTINVGGIIGVPIFYMFARVGNKENNYNFWGGDESFTSLYQRSIALTMSKIIEHYEKEIFNKLLEVNGDSIPVEESLAQKLTNDFAQELKDFGLPVPYDTDNIKTTGLKKTQDALDALKQQMNFKIKYTSRKNYELRSGGTAVNYKALSENAKEKIKEG